MNEIKITIETNFTGLFNFRLICHGGGKQSLETLTLVMGGGILGRKRLNFFSKFFYFFIFSIYFLFILKIRVILSSYVYLTAVLNGNCH